MENLALIESFSEFKDDKFIDRVTLMAILEEVFRAALKRKFGSDDNFDIIINPDKGDLEIWRNRVVVPDGEVEEPNEEISLTEARKIEPDFEVGEDVSEEVKLMDLGRRSILALRQNLIARIHEHDNTTIYKQFKDLEGEIYTAEVHHIRHRAIILLDDEGNELIMPKEKQIPSDFFRKGDNVRGIIESVELKGNKPLIIFSRTSPKFLEQLFHQEIPEVFDGLITVKKVVRIPGEKAKVAVDSYDDRIDPVGACVGMKGSRIHGIVRELGNENIDVLNWTNNPQLMVTRALSPARVTQVKLNDEDMTAQVYLKPEEVIQGHWPWRATTFALQGNLPDTRSMFTGKVWKKMWNLPSSAMKLRNGSLRSSEKLDWIRPGSVLEQDVEDLVKRTDLEEETILDVVRILKEEFED